MDQLNQLVQHQITAYNHLETGAICVVIALLMLEFAKISACFYIALRLVMVLEKFLSRPRPAVLATPTVQTVQTAHQAFKDNEKRYGPQTASR